MKQTKRMLALLLSVCMIFAMLPAAAYGADAPPELTLENAVFDNTEEDHCTSVYIWDLSDHSDYGGAISFVFVNEEKYEQGFDCLWGEDYFYDSSKYSLIIAKPDTEDFEIVVKAEGYDDWKIIGGKGYTPPANSAPAAKDPVPTQMVAPGGTATFVASDIADDADGNPLTITEIKTILSEDTVTAELADGIVTLTGKAAGETSVTVTVSDSKASVDVTVPVKVGLLPAPKLEASASYKEGDHVEIPINKADTPWAKALQAGPSVISIKKTSESVYKTATNDKWQAIVPGLIMAGMVRLYNRDGNSFFVDNGYEMFGSYDLKISAPGYEAASVSVNILKKAPSFTADTTDNKISGPCVEKDIELTFAEDAAYSSAINAVSVTDLNNQTTKYEASGGNFEIKESKILKLSKELFPKGGGDYKITVHANGYADTSAISQRIIGIAPDVNPDKVNYLLDENGKLKGALTLSFTDDPNWRRKTLKITINETVLSNDDDYTTSEGKIVLESDRVTDALKAGSNTITLEADGYYLPCTVEQIMIQPVDGPAIAADSSNNYPNSEIKLTFENNELYKAAITDILLDGQSAKGHYTIGAGEITLEASLFSQEKDYTIEVIANTYPGGEGHNYRTAVINQEIVNENPKEAPALTVNDAVPHYALNDVVLKIAVEDPAYEIHKVVLDGTAIEAGTGYVYDAAAKTLTIKGNLLTEGKDYKIEIKAVGYKTATVEIPVTLNPSPKFEFAGAKTGTSETVYYTYSDGLTIKMGPNGFAFYYDDCDEWYDVPVYRNYKYISIDETVLTSSTYTGIKQGTVVSVPDKPELANKKYFEVSGTAASKFKDTTGLHTIKIAYPGFEEAVISFRLVENDGVVLTPDSTEARVGTEIQLTFEDNEAWRNAISGVFVNGKTLEPTQYETAAGVLTLKKSAFSAEGTYEIVVHADNYMDSSVEQVIEAKLSGGSSGGGSAAQTPSVTAGEGGTAVLSKDGTTLTITPAEGYEIASVTLNGKEKGTAGTLTGLKTGDKVVVAFRKKAETGKRFDDVDSGDWFNGAVIYVADKGLMNGTGEKTFSPNEKTTRAMLMTILARMSGEDTDGGATWYQKGLDWAVANGISDGTNPEKNITREQLAAMLYRYADSPDTKGSLEAFKDADSVSAYAETAMKWAVEKGIVTGRTNGTLDPQNDAARAEMAAMLQRFCQIMEK